MRLTAITESRALYWILGTIAVLLSIPFAFMLFIMSIFASDGGTPTAMAIAYTIFGIALLYPVGTLVLAIVALKRRSPILIAIPFILSIALFGWMFGAILFSPDLN